MATAEIQRGVEPGAFVFELYQYQPSHYAAIISVVVFTVLTAIHVWRMYRTLAFYFTAFTIGGVCDPRPHRSGALRSLDLHHPRAPHPGPSCRTTLLHPVKWLTKIFVTSDVVAFTLQAGGGGIQSAGTLDLYELGEKIIVVGLFVQIIVFGIFVCTSVTVHRRISAAPTPTAVQGTAPWKRYLPVLYTTSFLIMIRSVFRVIEYLQGNGGYLISHEIYLYIFDTVLMAAVMSIFAVWYIGDLERNKLDINALESVGRLSLVTEVSTAQGREDAIEVKHMV